jgi:hypothetical protein
MDFTYRGCLLFTLAMVPASATGNWPRPCCSGNLDLRSPHRHGPCRFGPALRLMYIHLFEVDTTPTDWPWRDNSSKLETIMFIG